MNLVRIATPFALASAVACGGAPDPFEGGGGPTIVQVQAQVLTPRCATSGCHVSPGAPFDLDMSSASASKANLVSVAAFEMPSLSRVAPGDATNSYLYWKITANPNINGDPMPLSGGPLSQADIDLIAAWIDGGAK